MSPTSLKLANCNLKLKWVKCESEKRGEWGEWRGGKKKKQKTYHLLLVPGASCVWHLGRIIKSVATSAKIGVSAWLTIGCMGEGPVAGIHLYLDEWCRHHETGSSVAQMYALIYSFFPLSFFLLNIVTIGDPCPRTYNKVTSTLSLALCIDFRVE